MTYGNGFNHLFFCMPSVVLCTGLSCIPALHGIALVLLHGIGLYASSVRCNVVKEYAGQPFEKASSCPHSLVTENG